MLIFSTIAAIISPFVYLLPFIILWKNEGHVYYAIPKTEKTIKNKYVFIIKIILLIILSVLFVFTWPTKVMFYPVKVAIFMSFLVIIQLLTVFILDHDEKSKVADKIFSISIACWIVLGMLTIGVGIEARTIYNEKVIEDPFESVETFQVEHISNGNVFFYDETDKSLEVISISDDTLEIVLQENDLQFPYVEKITTYERYSILGDKDKVICDDMSTLSEKYILYVSKSDLYK